MLKRILIAAMFLLALAVAVLFTAMNPGEIELELGFLALQAPLGLAFILALALGWLLGLVSALPRILSLSSQRRRLRGQLRKAPSDTTLAVPDERG